MKSSSVWVFIAQLVEHCSTNAESTGSNPVEAPKTIFFWLLCNCLKINCDSTAMVTYLFHCIPAVHIISFCDSFLSQIDELNKLACLQCMVFIAQLVEHGSVNAEAMHLNPVEAKKNFFLGYFVIA